MTTYVDAEGRYLGAYVDVEAPADSVPVSHPPSDARQVWDFGAGDWLPAAVDLYAYAAQRRWEIETGGIVVAGASIRTDRESQALINGALSLVQAHPTAPRRSSRAGCLRRREGGSRGHRSAGDHDDQRS